MPLKRHFTCPLISGMHARPASALEEVARKFVSEMTLTNERNGRAANLKSVLAIVSTDTQQNDSCTLTVSGLDEKEAFAALEAFIEKELPHCDDALATNATS